MLALLLSFCWPGCTFPNAVHGDLWPPAQLHAHPDANGSAGDLPQP